MKYHYISNKRDNSNLEKNLSKFQVKTHFCQIGLEGFVKYDCALFNPEYLKIIIKF